MRKRILVAMLILALFFAGFSFSPSPVQAEDGDKLQRILQILNLPPERHGLKARLDRGQIVYGLPTDVPGNDWKPAPPDADGKDWQTANGIDLGHPGKEPRYLGYSWDGVNLISNDWFPIDAPGWIPPAQRDMIERPWDQGLASGDNGDVSDATWAVIRKALQDYHKRLGFGDGQGFFDNPAFKGDPDAVRDYFKVLAEPEPGLVGTVRHWHYRHDLGGIYYDTITVRWDLIPDFIVESIDPGVPGGQQVLPGQTYTGRVVLKARPDGSLLSDPLTKELFDAMGGELELTQDYTVPFGVAVNGRLVPVKDLRPIPGLGNVYQYNVPAGTTENTVEATFDWTVPADAGNKVTIAAAVNTIREVLPQEVWDYMDFSELTNTNNVKTVEVPVSVPDFYINIDPHQAEAKPGQELTFAVTAGLKNTFPRPWKALVRAFHVVDGVEYPAPLTLGGAPIAPDQPVEFQPGEEKQGTVTVHAQNVGSTVVVKINPVDTSEDADWSDNRDTAQIGTLVDIAVTAWPFKSPVDIPWWGSGQLRNGANIRVTRKDGGAGPVDVVVTVDGPAGSVSYTVTLAGGETKSVGPYMFTVSGEGEYRVHVEAWPTAVRDVNPSDNTADVVVEARRLPPPETGPREPGLHAELGG